MTSLLPWFAAAGFFVYSMLTVYRPGTLRKHAWLFPAALSFAFAAFSIYAILNEGIFGFWPEHTRNTWGNQIWFDLLLAVGIGWGLAAPKARALGIRLLPWLFLILCTGSMGLLAMLARILYVENQHHNQNS